MADKDIFLDIKNVFSNYMIQDDVARWLKICAKFRCMVENNGKI